MNSPTQNRYASTLKELSILGGQIAYHFPDYRAILDNVQPLGTKYFFMQQTQLMVIVQEIAIIKVNSLPLKKIASTKKKSNALAKAFETFFGGEKINIVFICDNDIIRLLPEDEDKKQSSDDGQASIFDLLGSELFKNSPKKMNTKTLKTYLDQYDTETDPENKMKLANAMIDVVKDEIWSLTGQLIESHKQEQNRLKSPANKC